MAPSKKKKAKEAGRKSKGGSKLPGSESRRQQQQADVQVRAIWIYLEHESGFDMKCTLLSTDLNHLCRMTAAQTVSGGRQVKRHICTLSGAY